MALMRSETYDRLTFVSMPVPGSNQRKYVGQNNVVVVVDLACLANGHEKEAGLSLIHI